MVMMLLVKECYIKFQKASSSNQLSNYLKKLTLLHLRPIALAKMVSLIQLLED